jgi:ABC-type transport system substrate-binding protein
MEGALLGSRRSQRRQAAFYYNNRGSLTDADTFYDQYFRTGTTKRCNYSNPAFDKLIDEEQQTPDNKNASLCYSKPARFSWTMRLCAAV